MKNFTQELEVLVSEAENTIISFVKGNSIPDHRGRYCVFLEGVDHWVLTTDMEEDEVKYRPHSVSVIETESGDNLFVNGIVPGTNRTYSFFSIEVPVHLIMEIGDAIS